MNYMKYLINENDDISNITEVINKLNNINIHLQKSKKVNNSKINKLYRNVYNKIDDTIKELSKINDELHNID